MKGHYRLKTNSIVLKNARLYSCSHPLYDKCTLFQLPAYPNLGLAVIQQRFNEEEKVSWWGPIDRRLTGDISDCPAFSDFFIRYAGYEEHGLYPTIELRKLMNALGLKPIRKDFWESPLNAKKAGLIM